MKKLIYSLLAIFIITLLSFIDSFTGTPFFLFIQFILIVGVFVLPLSLILYLVIPSRYKSKRESKKGIILGVIALISLVGSYLSGHIGHRLLILNIENRGAPVIKALDIYYEFNKTYPSKLENLNVNNPSWFGSDFYYLSHPDRPYFRLGFRFGYRESYYWDSTYKKWMELTD